MSDIGQQRKPGKRRSGPLRKPGLEKAALHYLERYASSAEGLRRVLRRRVERAAREGRCDPDEANGWIDEIVGRFAGSGLVDDRSFAEGRAASLRRRGESARLIAARLRQKGVDAELVAEVLAGEDGDDRDAAERAAAERLARRRRLGPYRPEEQRSARRERDLEAFARAGFSYEIAVAVVDSDGD